MTDMPTLEQIQELQQALAEARQRELGRGYEHDYITVDKTSGNRFLLDQALRGVRVKKPSICETTPRDHHDRLGRGGAGCGDGAVDCHAGH